MTKGDEIWAEAIRVVGVYRVLADPHNGVPELGREVIRRIDEALAKRHVSDTEHQLIPRKTLEWQ